jgi:homoserine dehydrogenase
LKEVKLIIVGFGVIGRGLANTLLDKRSHLRSQGLDLKVAGVCEAQGSIVSDSGVDLKRLLSSKPRWGRAKTQDVIRDTEADIVVELTPGNIKTGEPGLSHMVWALNSGKHVVSSNKSPLVVAYDKLLGLAGKNNLSLKFEATVAGAIPVLETLKRELRANKAQNIYGILNGTTNYILSKMAEEGVDYHAALAEAQSMGYAESDPKYDIMGVDTGAKLTILSNYVLGEPVKFSELTIEGIERVTPEAVHLAGHYGYAIKLVADVRGKTVAPTLIPKDHPLNIPGNLNAVLVETDLAGDLTLIGAGAGPRETSSALLQDIIETSKQL